MAARKNNFRRLCRTASWTAFAIGTIAEFLGFSTQDFPQSATPLLAFHRAATEQLAYPAMRHTAQFGDFIGG